MFVDKYLYIYTCVCTSNLLQDQVELWYDPTDFEHVELLALAGQKEDVDKEEEKKDERGDENVKGEEEEEREDENVKGEEEEEREEEDVKREEEEEEEKEERAKDDVERDEEVKDGERRGKKRRRRRRESSEEDEEYLSRRADHYLKRLHRSRAHRESMENRDG